jgi:hypothetical protein
MMCVEGSSPNFPSNFGMFDGNLDGIVDEKWSWEIESFVNRGKYCKSSIARNKNSAMKTGREVKSLLSQVDLVVRLCCYFWKGEEFLERECPQG